MWTYICLKNIQLYLNVGQINLYSELLPVSLTLFLGKTRKIVDETSWLPKSRGLAFSKQPLSRLAKMVYNGSKILSSEVWFPCSAIFRTMIFRYSSFLGERYLIKFINLQQTPAWQDWFWTTTAFIIHPKYAPFSDWLKGQLVLTIFGRCEQYTIYSMAHFIGNDVDRWYIWLDTRLHGK